MKVLNKLLINTSIIALGVVANSTAQEKTENSDNKIHFDEITVTAQKRPELLQDTPIAITVFNQKELDIRSVASAASLQLLTPNFTHTQTNFGEDNFTIRGIGRTAIGDGAESGVAFHVNQMYIHEGSPVGFFDLERVEILRGPQGTLFGRSATGGAINITTAKPVSEFEGYAEVTVGNQGVSVGEFMLNLPVSGDLALRFAASIGKTGGFVKNITTGNTLNGGRDFSFRGSASWTPTADTTFNLVAEYRRVKSTSLQGEKSLCKRDPVGNLGCLPDELGNASPNFLATTGGHLSYFMDMDPFTDGVQSLYNLDTDDPYANAGSPDDIRKITSDFDPETRINNFYLTLEISHDFEKFKLDSVTGFTKNDSFYVKDTDLAAPTLAYNAIPGLFDKGLIPISRPDPKNGGSLTGQTRLLSATPFTLTRGDSKSRQLLQEVRFSSKFDGAFNFLAGGSFLDNNKSANFYEINSAYDAYALSRQRVADLLGTDESFAPPFFRLETPTDDLRAYAIFGEVYLQATETLHLTGGLRWSRDEKILVDRSLFFSLRPFETNKASFDTLTGRAGFDWQPEIGSENDMLVYGFFSRGSKSGGFNPQGENEETPATFDPEYINSFEIGLKTTLGGSLRANLTGFYYDYDGLQVAKSVNRTVINENIDAKSFGIEAEFLFAPNEYWMFNANIGFLDTSIQNTSSIDPRDPTGGAPDLITIKDINNGSNCVATLTQLFTLLDGTPFGDCSNPAFIDGIPVSLNGNQFQNAPRWNLSLGAEYHHPVGSDYYLTLRADYIWRSDFWGRIFNRDPVDRIDSWSRLNMSIRFASETQPWYILLNVSNVLDGKNMTGIFLNGPSSGLSTRAFYLPPRTVTVTIRRNF